MHQAHLYCLRKRKYPCRFAFPQHKPMRKVNDSAGTPRQLKDTAARQIQRASPVVREAAQVKDTAAHQIERASPVVREAQQVKNTAARRIERAKPGVRDAKQVTNTAARRNAAGDCMQG
jgi:hypothetical protein